MNYCIDEHAWQRHIETLGPHKWILIYIYIYINLNFSPYEIQTFENPLQIQTFLSQILTNRKSTYFNGESWISVCLFVEKTEREREKTWSGRWIEFSNWMRSTTLKWLNSIFWQRQRGQLPLSAYSTGNFYKSFHLWVKKREKFCVSIFGSCFSFHLIADPSRSSLYFFMIFAEWGGRIIECLIEQECVFWITIMSGFDMHLRGEEKASGNRELRDYLASHHVHARHRRSRRFNLDVFFYISVAFWSHLR